MRPLALTIAAKACAGGPTMAIDLPGADAKVSATTTMNQQATTKAAAVAILANDRNHDGRRLPSIVIEMLDARAPGLEIPVDVDQTINPSAQTGPAKAGS